MTLVEGMTVSDFNSIWSDWPSSVCYSWTSVVACNCTDEGAVRGCVKDSKQSTWFFENQWDVQIRKLVYPTANPWVFDVNISLRWKRVIQTRKDLNVCSVVVFDISWSMKDCNAWKMWSNWICSSYASTRNKWNSAKSWAILFSDVVTDWNPNAKVWLVLFWTKAQIKQTLSHASFSESLFPTLGSENTNLQDWLIKAWEVLSDEQLCDVKYVIIMSDWVPTHYLSWNSAVSAWSPNYTKAKEYAIDEAQKLKDKWIQIYSIGYEIPDTAKTTLKTVASSLNYYFDAEWASISEIFQTIWDRQVEVNAWKQPVVQDVVGEYIVWKIWDLNIVANAEIWDPGSVYSFQIKVDPMHTWWQASNDWLSLTYIDATWDNQTLSISQENTAQIYWTAPKCEWIYPREWNSIKIWADEFTQNWSWTVLVPVTKKWEYTSNSNPWECEWTCNDEIYGWNTITNSCELFVNVKFDLNWWTWNISDITVISWMTIDEPTNNPIRTWYSFSWWTLNDEIFEFPWLVTWNIILKAKRELNKYEVVFNWNSSISGTMWNQTFTYDVTWILNTNLFIWKEWYHFTWWNTKSDGSGSWFLENEEIKNLATSWEVDLFAQWEPNVYTVVFDWNWATKWLMNWLNVTYDREIKLNKNQYERSSHKFVWRNTSPDWMWDNYTDEQIVKNLVTSWEIKLYAQWQRLWSSWGGWWGCIKDDCPDGDYSWDRCDGKCWEKPDSDPEPKIISETIIKNCSIEGSTYSDEINEAYVWACQKWIIESNTIQGAKLWEFLNRAEMAKITALFEMWELGANPNINKDCLAFYGSISWYNQEMKGYMITSCQLERMWIHTADHTPITDFMPSKFVSRAEFWTVLSRILWWRAYEAEENSKYYYVKHLNQLKEGWVLTNIDPNLVEYRSYVILMIYRAARMLWKN